MQRKFVSAKKSLNVAKVAKIVGATAKPADDKKFQSFRKENYYETVQSMKELRAREIEEDKLKEVEAMAQEKAAYFGKLLHKKNKPRTYGN